MAGKRNQVAGKSGIDWQAVILAVTAIAGIIYAALTWQMLAELKRANELQFDFQSQMLLPVVTQQVSRDMLNAGKPDEQWVVKSLLVNTGQVPALEVKGGIYWDSQESVVTQQPIEEIGAVVLHQNGGNITVTRMISKEEAVAVMKTRPLYFHSLAWFQDASGTQYLSQATYECKYMEGKFLELVPINSAILRYSGENPGKGTG